MKKLYSFFVRQIYGMLIHAVPHQELHHTSYQNTMLYPGSLAMSRISTYGCTEAGFQISAKIGRKFLTYWQEMVIMVIITLLVSSFTKAFGTEYTSMKSGNWNNAIWSGGGTGYPVAGDNATIASSTTVTIIASEACANLTIASGGTLILSGANTLTISGNWTNNGGTFTYSSGTVTFNGTGAQAINGTATSQTFYNVVISKTAGTTLSVSGSTTALTVNNFTETTGNFTAPATLTINGNVTLTAGTLTAGTTTNIKGNWTNNGGTFTHNSGSVTFNGSSSQSIGGSSSTTFNNLTLNNTLGVTLGTDQTVNGTLTVIAGTTFNVTSKNISAASVVLENGASASTISGTGTLTLGGNVNVNYTGGSGSGASISCPVALGATTRTFTVSSETTSANDLTLSGAISGLGGLTMTDTGTSVLSGSNTYSGTTTIGAGTVKLGSASALGGTATGTIITTGAVLDLNGIDYTNAEPLTVNGTGISNGGAITNSSGAAAVFNGQITTGSSWSIIANAGDIDIAATGNIGGTYSYTIGGSGNGKLRSPIATGGAAATVTKIGNGTWTLSGNSGYSGLITINAGILKLGATGDGTLSPLGKTLAGTTVSSGAALDLNGYTLSTAEPLTLKGTGISNGGALINSSGTGATFSGTIALNSASSIGTTGDISLVSQGISGGQDLTKTGSAILNLGSGNAYLNNLNINSGNFISTSGTLSLTGAITNSGTFTHNSGTVDFSGSGSQTIPALDYYNLTSSNSGARVLASSGTIKVAGTFTPGSNSYTTTGSSIDFNGSGAQTIPSFTFNNLTTSNTGTKTIAAGSDVTVGSNLTTNGLLTINSDALGNNGSLIVNGSGSGNITYNRYVASNPLRWYITSVPVSVSSGFDTNNASKIKYGTVNYDFAWYKESNNEGWQYYTSIPSSLTSGQGYLIRLKTNYTNIQYTGTLNGNISLSLPSTGLYSGWNAVGNPFTSAIKVKGADGFITQNVSALEDNYAAIYLWHSDQYKVLANVGYTPESYHYGTLTDDNVQAGQGFMVNIKYPGPRSISLNKGTSYLQVHAGTRELKSAVISWPGITLLAENNGQTRSTIVCFDANMTTGLDKSYDAGLLSASGFEIYTLLVSSGKKKVNFAIQSLPDNQYTSLVVPVGITLPADGQVTFKAAGIILPTNVYPVLEDKKLRSKTAFKTETDSYSVNVAASEKGTGRFYLRFADASKSGLPDLNNSEDMNFTAWFTEQKIVISGYPQEEVKALLFDINGRKLGEYPILQEYRHEIPAEGLINGIYLLNIEGKNSRQLLKVPVIR